LASGAVPELFDHEFPRVLENIQDPNTDAKKVRKVQITLEFKPDENRETAAVKVTLVTSLPGIDPVTASIFLSREGGRCVAYAREKTQTELDYQKPVPIEGGRKEEPE